ncbi:MAG: type II toxin-antitoxin system Phd/YefM family antitoxin [Candidatus Sericytochromatia bacterium]|nr:type II toxin-antitoxin system Phd/YefM family antitoxin [Candidatus Tanganyikabacteria bacterium]
MRVVTVHEAKTNLSRLLAFVQAGETIVIAKNGRPVARLVACEPAGEPRPIGLMPGAFGIRDDFNDPLPEAELQAFEG